jgi:release factor glutamine methyltransferase
MCATIKSGRENIKPYKLGAVTVLEAIQRSTEFLSRKGVESPRLQTELLLAHVLELPRMQLYLNFERPLTPGQVDTLRLLVQRRGRREPVQYILGSTSFCGWEFAVNPHVLVPRPETELLAELGWQFLGELPARACEFGAGSGCLVVALALKCPAASLHALERSPEALNVARQNAARHGVADRIRFLLSDGFSAVPHGTAFDLILSNPPYIPTPELATLEPEVREHEPRCALDGGPDGLDYFRCLAATAGSWLRPAGRLMVEFGDGQAAAVAEMFGRENWVVEAIHEDYTHRPRLMVARRE